MTILHYSANMKKKFQKADSQSPPENQLKRYILILVTSALLIKWEVNLGISLLTLRQELPVLKPKHSN